MIRLTKRTSHVAFYTEAGASVVTEAVHADGEVYDDGAEYATYGDGSERLIRRRPTFECRVMDARVAAKLRQWAAAGVAVSALEIGRGRLGQFLDPVVPVVPASGSAGTFAADGYPVRLSSSLRLHRSGRSHDLFLDPFVDADADGVADGWTLDGGVATFADGQALDGGARLYRDRSLPVPGLRLAAFAEITADAGGGVLRCIALDGSGDELAAGEVPIGATGAGADRPGYYFAPLTTPDGTRSVRVELVEEGRNAGGIEARRVELVVGSGAPTVSFGPGSGVLRLPASASGGYGPVSERVVRLPDSAGTVTLDYVAGDDQSDAFELVYEGGVVATTGGAVFGEGSLGWDYPAAAGAAPGAARVLVVRVTSPAETSLWSFTVTVAP